MSLAFMWTCAYFGRQVFLSGWEADGRRTVKDRRSVPISSVRKDLVDSISWLARLNSRTTYISERNSKYPSVYVSNRGETAGPTRFPREPLRTLKELLESARVDTHPQARRTRPSRKRRAEKALQEIIITAAREK